MDAEGWKATLGESAWAHIMESDIHLNRVVEQMVAGILNRAVEAGFTPPSTQPTISPNGTKVLWPRADGSVMPLVTAEGLRRSWARRGHGWVALRVHQLMHACAGTLLPWLQLIFSSYENQCQLDGVEILPVDWRVFVGGEKGECTSAELADAFFDSSPRPDPAAIKRLHIRGQGDWDRK